MQNKDYWLKRSIELESKLLNKGESYLEDLNNLYRKISLDIEKDLSVWYSRFARNNSISITEVKKWLNTKELSEFKWTIAEYIKYAEMDSLDKAWLKQLENASAKYHISRLEALKIQLQHHVEVLYAKQINDISKVMKEIYTEGYYNTSYELQKSVNVGFSLIGFNENELEKILSKPWAIDGSNFSDRIWTNKTNLVNVLQQELTAMVVRGESPNKSIKNISTKFNASKASATRIVMTESSYFASKSQEDSYKDSGVERYEILATLDIRTSEICEELDGKIFLVKDYAVGISAPPFHPNCRTTTIPYYEDIEVSTRAARSIDDKTYKVPSNMTYQQWYDKFIRPSK